MTPLLLVLAAYGVGSFPTSYLGAKLGAGIDLRDHGSGNAGATNLYRVLGWKYAVPAALLDVAKGTVPVTLFPGLARTDDMWFPLVLGAAAVVGHVFPIFLGFKGGKGVATAAGVVLALAPLAFVVSGIVWLGAVVATRYVSIASMTGAAVFPIAVRLTDPEKLHVFGVGLALAAFIVFTHRSNIRRLIAGTENRFGRRGRVA